MKEFHEGKLRPSSTQEGEDPFFIELIALLDKYKMDVTFFAGVGNFDEEGPALYTSVLYGDATSPLAARLLFRELCLDVHEAIRQEKRDQGDVGGEAVEE